MLFASRRRTPGSPGRVRRLLSLAVASALAIPAVVLTTSTPAQALNAPISGIASTPTRGGYWLVARDGGVFSFGDAPFRGSMASYALPAPVVGITSTASGLGYWLVGSDGAVYAFGDAVNWGSMAGKPLSKPVVGIAATPSGQGYWLASGDGGVFAFGDAAFRGNMVGQPLNQPISGIASHPTSGGYWLTAGDGGVFAFGAPFHGSMGGRALNKPITGIASSRTGNGYWLVGGDGGIYAFGDAPFRGSTGGVAINGTMVGMAQGPAGDGYWLTATDGGVFAFGSAPYLGNMVSSAPPQSGNTRPTNDKLRSDIVAMAKRHIGYDTPSENTHNFTERERYVTRAWCADFISDVWVESGVQGWARTPRVDKVREYAEKRGMFRNRDYTPQPGDVAIYKGNGVSHVNIVVEVNGGQVRTIGGNEGRDTVVHRGFFDPKKAFKGALVGYALPSDPAQPYHQEDTSGQQPEQDQPENVVPDATVSDATVREGGIARFTVTLDYAVSYPIALTYSTVDGTALSVADLDYRAARSVNVQLAAGQTSVVIEVPTTHDTLPELAESFSLEVASTDAVALLDGVAAGRIEDDDSL